MKHFHLALTLVFSFAELGLIFYMFSGHYTNEVGIAALVGLAFSIIFFLFYLLQEKQDEIEKIRRKRSYYDPIKQTPSANN
jgi:hypothetical protein